jgi:hypothetical protein
VPVGLPWFQGSEKPALSASGMRWAWKQHHLTVVVSLAAFRPLNRPSRPYTLPCRALVPPPTHTPPPQLPQVRYLRAILTSHAKCGELEAALSLIKRSKEAELQVCWAVRPGLYCCPRDACWQARCAPTHAAPLSAYQPMCAAGAVRLEGRAELW